MFTIERKLDLTGFRTGGKREFGFPESFETNVLGPNIRRVLDAKRYRAALAQPMHRGDARIIGIQHRGSARFHSVEKLGFCLRYIFYRAEMLEMGADTNDDYAHALMRGTYVNGGMFDLGWPVGFWAAELFHPYYEFVQRRYDVTICSPEGGKVEVDAMSDPRDASGWRKPGFSNLAL